MWLSFSNIDSISVSVVLVIGLTLAYAEPVAESDWANRVCSDENLPVHRVSQFKIIAEQVKHQETGCSNLQRDAIFELSKALEDIGIWLCSSESLEALRAFHKNYISASSPYSEILPKALVRFFIAYALRVGEQCTTNLPQSLEADIAEYLDSEDGVAIDQWAGKKSLVGQLFKSYKSYVDLVFLTDVASNRDKANHKTIRHSLANGEAVEVLQSKCKLRYKPIYDQLIIPLVRLSPIGYNYQLTTQEQAIVSLETNQKLANWHRLTFICESVLGVDLMKKKFDGEPSVEVVDNVPPSDDQVSVIQTENTTSDVSSKASEVKPIDSYKFKHVIEIDDLIIDTENKRLMRTLRKFKTNRDDLEEAEKTSVRMFFNVLRRSLTQTLNPLNYLPNRDHFKLNILSTIDNQISRGSALLSGNDRMPRRKAIKMLAMCGGVILILALFVLGCAFMIG